MKKKLKKRIITSILLFLIAIFCIFINWPIYILTIIIVSGIALSEIVDLVFLVEKSTSAKNWMVFGLISFYFISFSFLCLWLDLFIVWDQYLYFIFY